ncbi:MULTISPECIES: GTP 3',8-cyclase MoaA [unclassified Fusibacter]|uniref:GTP 3',8-cyclase MoaA n=1 Tax=unclassified Fusibacter TaxID=2624464 RepID=UPI001010508E|nr:MULTISPECIES: GTP 3',8-cyclase MoaA [unclassified Fusibacter]MCK8058542.1 GTP 3',8-cyclase MoaA [Fusibacter sp. A2]NPE22689.1 GTP 3',8-cyclase MoaA [Fusibacter sp. A1]RXV60249.1 GTP 3',8-cyclase MoaA [Fusibacter sp. A1]
MRDQYGRTIEYLRIAVTDQCNLSCKYCKTGESCREEKRVLSADEIVRVAQVMVDMGIKKIRLTGGEPLLADGIIALVARLKSISGLKELTLTTNGVLLNRYAKGLKEAGLDRVNISLDSLDRDSMKELTGRDCLDLIFEGIRAADAAGLTPIKLNTVLIGGFNDHEINDFINLTLTHDLDIRFIELMPIGQAAYWQSHRFIASDTVLKANKNLIEITEDSSSPARYFKLEGARGRVGLISAMTCDFCDRCNRLRLTYDGKLKPCLHTDIEVDLLDSLESDEWIADRIEEAVQNKPQKHHAGDKGHIPVKRAMFRIGG